MKKENNVMYVVRLAATLLIIAGVMAAALAGVNSVTAPIIENITYEKTQEAVSAVLPGGGDSIEFPATDLVSKVYQGENGYAVEVTPSGFDNTITMMVGIDASGAVSGISIIDHSETAGLGAVAAATTAAGEAFRGQFKGLTGSVSVSKDGGQIDAITGATITSRAVCEGVNAALAVAAKLG